jgi:hypothetical protein
MLPFSSLSSLIWHFVIVSRSQPRDAKTTFASRCLVAHMSLTSNQNAVHSFWFEAVFASDALAFYFFFERDNNTTIEPTPTSGISLGLDLCVQDITLKRTYFSHTFPDEKIAKKRQECWISSRTRAATPIVAFCRGFSPLCASGF